MAAFSTGERRQRGKSDRRATEITCVIRAALEQTILLELLPGSQIDIFLQACILPILPHIEIRSAKVVLMVCCLEPLYRCIRCCVPDVRFCKLMVGRAVLASMQQFLHWQKLVRCLHCVRSEVVYAVQDYFDK